MRPGTTAIASVVAPAPHQINMVAALHQSRCVRPLVAIVAADVDPLQPIWRPRSAPAAVVGGVGIGRAKERKAMEAVMEAMMGEVVPVPEREPCRPVRESGMRKGRSRETAAAEMPAAKMGAAEMRAAPHAAEVHAATTHAASHAAMHAASHAAAMPTATATTTAATKRR